MSTNRVDWTAIRARLEAARAALDTSLTRTGDEAQRILVERASALARVPAATDAGDSLEVIEFALAGEAYAIESKYVEEIAILTSLTPVPCTPSFVLGVAGIRGEVVAVLDLRTLFDFPPKGISNLDSALVLRSGASVFAIVADSIGGVQHIPIHELQADLPTLTGVREKYLRGVTAARVVVLDGAALLSDESLVAREQVQ